MKILNVIASMHPEHGGTSQGVRNAIPALATFGLENEVVCMDDPDAEFIKADDFVIHAIGNSKGPWQYQEKLLPWLLNNIANYQRIIIHGLWLYHSYAVNKAMDQYKRTNKSVNIPAVYIMPHGMLDPYFQQASTRKLKALRNWLYWKLIENKVVNGAEGMFFTCEEELKLARIPFSPYRPKSEWNVGYGIPQPPAFHATMWDQLVEKFPQIIREGYWLFLSRVNEKKGIDLLVHAYLNLKKKGNLKIPQLVVAGPGLETAFGQHVQQVAAGEKDIIFTGMLEGNMKWGAIYGAQAFILPSHQENFGIAVVEALACVKPVLISDQVNIWREIEALDGGIVESDTQEGVTIMLEKWVELSDAHKQRMAEQALAVYHNYFTIEQAAKRMAQALKSLKYA